MPCREVEFEMIQFTIHIHTVYVEDLCMCVQSVCLVTMIKGGLETQFLSCHRGKLCALVNK